MGSIAQSVARSIAPPGKKTKGVEIDVETDAPEGDDAEGDAESPEGADTAMSEFKDALDGGNTADQVKAFKKLMDICMEY